jgi:hypothetical protein
LAAPGGIPSAVICTGLGQRRPVVPTARQHVTEVVARSSGGSGTRQNSVKQIVLDVRNPLIGAVASWSLSDSSGSGLARARNRRLARSNIATYRSSLGRKVVIHQRSRDTRQRSDVLNHDIVIRLFREQRSSGIEQLFASLLRLQPPRCHAPSPAHAHARSHSSNLFINLLPFWIVVMARCAGLTGYRRSPVALRAIQDQPCTSPIGRCRSRCSRECLGLPVGAARWVALGQVLTVGRSR